MLSSVISLKVKKRNKNILKIKNDIMRSNYIYFITFLPLSYIAIFLKKSKAVIYKTFKICWQANF